MAINLITNQTVVWETVWHFSLHQDYLEILVTTQQKEKKTPTLHDSMDGTGRYSAK